MATQVGDVIEVTVIHDNDTSGEQVNRFQFMVLAGGPISDSDLLDDVKTIIETLYILVVSIISLRNVLREVGVFNKTQSILIGVTTAGTYVGGNATDPASPQGVSPYCYFKTNIPHVILSKYLPSVAQARIGISGLWTSPTLGATTAFAVRLLASFTELSGSYQYGHQRPVILDFIYPHVAVIPLEPAYQRRRKPGRGS